MPSDRTAASVGPPAAGSDAMPAARVGLEVPVSQRPPPREGELAGPDELARDLEVIGQAARFEDIEGYLDAHGWRRIDPAKQAQSKAVCLDMRAGKKDAFVRTAEIILGDDRELADIHESFIADMELAVRQGAAAAILGQLRAIKPETVFQPHSVIYALGIARQLGDWEGYLDMCLLFLGRNVSGAGRAFAGMKFRRFAELLMEKLPQDQRPPGVGRLLNKDIEAWRRWFKKADRKAIEDAMKGWEEELIKAQRAD